MTQEVPGLQASILGVSVWGPGLEGWAASRAVLSGAVPYQPRASVPPAPSILGATERRRTGPVIRLALTVAQDAAAQAEERWHLAPASLRSVFGSSNGDGVVVGTILDAMARGAEGERVVSPTQFHNSVHNAAAGYWTIAHGSRQPATCLGAHDWTWAASLLKAMVEVVSEQCPVLLCCYDHPLPPPLDVLRPTGAAFAVGLVLGPVVAGAPRLQVEWRSGGCAHAVLPVGLDTLRGMNAVAGSLPLLAGLAAEATVSHAVPYLDGHLAVGLEHPSQAPC